MTWGVDVDVCGGVLWCVVVQGQCTKGKDCTYAHGAKDLMRPGSHHHRHHAAPDYVSTHTPAPTHHTLPHHTQQTAKRERLSCVRCVVCWFIPFFPQERKGSLLPSDVHRKVVALIRKAPPPGMNLAMLRNIWRSASTTHNTLNTLNTHHTSCGRQMCQLCVVMMCVTRTGRSIVRI